MRLLSFDTSAREITAALLVGGQVLAFERIVFEADVEVKGSGKKVSRQESVSLLLPTIDRLLRENNIAKGELDGLAVGIGPGGFTGIRVAVTTARTMAQALERPLLGINSLEVASYGEPSEKNAGVIKHASASHCYMAIYKRVFSDSSKSGAAAEFDLSAVLEPSYVKYEEIGSRLTLAPCWYAEQAVLKKLEGAGENLCELPAVTNVAAIQAKLAYLRLSLKGANQGSFPFRQVEPLYLRGASVTLKKGDAVERIESN